MGVLCPRKGSKYSMEERVTFSMHVYQIPTTNQTVQRDIQKSSYLTLKTNVHTTDHYNVHGVHSGGMGGARKVFTRLQALDYSLLAQTHEQLRE